jgi:hypothetical protein
MTGGGTPKGTPKATNSKPPKPVPKAGASKGTAASAGSGKGLGKLLGNVGKGLVDKVKAKFAKDATGSTASQQSNVNGSASTLSTNPDDLNGFRKREHENRCYTKFLQCKTNARLDHFADNGMQVGEIKEKFNEYLNNPKCNFDVPSHSNDRKMMIQKYQKMTVAWLQLLANDPKNTTLLDKCNLSGSAGSAGSGSQAPRPAGPRGTTATPRTSRTAPGAQPRTAPGAQPPTAPGAQPPTAPGAQPRTAPGARPSTAPGAPGTRPSTKSKSPLDAKQTRVKQTRVKQTRPPPGQQRASKNKK